MRGVTYAFLGPEDAAAKFAKKGTTTDITLFNAKQGDAHLNLVTAPRYPEKLSSLLTALDLSDEIILHVNAIDRNLGETIVGADLFGKTKGFVRVGPTVDVAQLKTILAQTGLKSVEVNEEPEAVFRERLYERASASSEGPLVLPVDHAFPVKGVGTVILGLVRSGEVKVHQALRVYPTDRILDVRTIQVHDVDQKAAPARSRVGLSVKGVEAADANRGTVLAPDGSLQVTEAGTPFDLHVDLHPFNKWTPRPGAVPHLFHVLQDVVVRVEAVKSASKTDAQLTLKADAPFVRVPGQPLVLVDLDNKQQRFIGRARVGA